MVKYKLMSGDDELTSFIVGGINEEDLVKRVNKFLLEQMQLMIHNLDFPRSMASIHNTDIAETIEN